MVLSTPESISIEENMEDYNLGISSSRYNKYYFQILKKCNNPNENCNIFLKLLNDHLLKLFDIEISSVYPLFKPRDDYSLTKNYLDLGIDKKFNFEIDMDLDLKMFPEKKRRIKIKVQNIKQSEPNLNKSDFKINEIDDE
jgi:hypothetical protein